MWTTRMMLESLQHHSSIFITLTYAPEHLPVDGSVDPREVQLFLKRLRRNSGIVGLRFVAVGEYGTVGHRPHYHLVVFGIAVLDHHKLGPGDDWKVCKCVVCRSWGKGGCDIGGVTAASCGYTVSYVLKNATKAGDERLKGRKPEFARFSLGGRTGKGGIGAGAAKVIAAAGVDRDGVLLLGGDAPSVVRFDRKMPLGRYMKGKVAEKIGVQSVLEEMRMLRAMESAESLRTVQARNMREVQREGHRNIAEGRLRLSREKKGNEAL